MKLFTDTSTLAGHSRFFVSPTVQLVARKIDTQVWDCSLHTQTGERVSPYRRVWAGRDNPTPAQLYKCFKAIN